MGSTNTKVAPLTSESVSEQLNRRSPTIKTKGTGCWAGIKKVLSRNTKVVPLASKSDANDDDGDGNDDDQLVQTTTTASVVTAPTAVKPAELHRHAPKVVRSDPIGQKREPVIISQEVKSSPVIGQKFRSGRPSTSRPVDVGVSSGYFLYYHRYVDDSDRESGDEDTSNEYVSDADDESVDDAEKTTTPKMIVRRHRGSSHSGKKGKSLKSGVSRMKSKKVVNVSRDVSSDDDEETSHVTRRRKMVKKDDLDSKTKMKVIEQIDDNAATSQTATDSIDKVTVFLASLSIVVSSLPLAPDDNEASSQIATDSIDKVTVFLASLSIIVASLPLVFSITEVLLFIEIAKQMENERRDRERAAAEALEAGARIPPESDQQVQEDNYSSTDPDQPGTSYKREKHATYDFLIRNRFKKIINSESSDEDDIW